MTVAAHKMSRLTNDGEVSREARARVLAPKNALPRLRDSFCDGSSAAA